MGAPPRYLGPYALCVLCVKQEQPDLITVFIHRPSRLLNDYQTLMTTLYLHYIQYCELYLFSTVNNICTMYFSNNNIIILIISNVYIQTSYISMSFSAFCCMRTLQMLNSTLYWIIFNCFCSTKFCSLYRFNFFVV